MTGGALKRQDTMTELPRIGSVDDHVIEPPHLFDTWLPAEYRARGPKRA